MNEDKMELEEAIELTNRIADMSIYNYVPNIENTDFIPQGKPTYMLGDKGRLAIKTVLQALENSIPKKKIEDKKEENSKLFFETKDVRYANRFKVLQELLEDK